MRFLVMQLAESFFPQRRGDGYCAASLLALPFVISEPSSSQLLFWEPIASTLTQTESWFHQTVMSSRCPGGKLGVIFSFVLNLIFDFVLLWHSLTYTIKMNCDRVTMNLAQPVPTEKQPWIIDRSPFKAPPH